MGSYSSRHIAAPFMFPAPKPSYSMHSMPSPPLYMIDGTPCMWFPAVRPRATVLYLHANGVDLGIIRSTMLKLSRASGCSILAVEYPGYGASHTEKPSPEGAVAAAVRAYKYLSAAHRLPIIVVGRSIGTGVATQTVRRVNKIASATNLRLPQALVLISPFRSIAHMTPAQSLHSIVGDVYNTEHTVQYIQCSTIILHGDGDPLIAIDQGRAVYDASGAPTKRFVIMAGYTHNDIDWNAIANWINKASLNQI